MSVVVQTVAPAASPCASGRSHPTAGYAGPDRTCVRGDPLARGQRRMGAATGGAAALGPDGHAV